MSDRDLFLDGVQLVYQLVDPASVVHADLRLHFRWQRRTQRLVDLGRHRAQEVAHSRRGRFVSRIRWREEEAGRESTPLAPGLAIALNDSRKYAAIAIE